jgi:5-methylcytosine-specific restriction endonuclease McrA
VHRLTNKDFDAKTADCANCGPVALQIIGNSYQCQVAYRELRAQYRRDRKGNPLPPKKVFCEHCGFRGEPCQLDRDHINGDRRDHRAENIQTLCANCHRLKSFMPEKFS